MITKHYPTHAWQVQNSLINSKIIQTKRPTSKGFYTYAIPPSGKFNLQPAL